MEQKQYFINKKYTFLKKSLAFFKKTTKKIKITFHRNTFFKMSNDQKMSGYSLKNHYFLEIKKNKEPHIFFVYLFVIKNNKI